MSLATLERIDILLKRLSTYTIAHRIAVVKPTIYELYKELYPFISDKERKEAQQKYVQKIKEMPIKKTSSYDNSYTYPTDLLMLMEEFDFWIRDKLHEKGLLMAKSDDPTLALGR